MGQTVPNINHTLIEKLWVTASRTRRFGKFVRVAKYTWDTESKKKLITLNIYQAQNNFLT